MIVVNAVITSYKPAAGFRGDGQALVGQDAVSSPVPCRVAPPTARHVGTLRATDLEADLAVHVSRRRLDALGVTPGSGDRLSVRRGRPGAQSLEHRVAAVHESAAGAAPGQIDVVQLLVAKGAPAQEVSS